MEHGYRPDIDGLRGVAVLAVVVYHAFPELLPGGFVGVDIFFVISGYLITRDIVARRAAGTFTLVDFYQRRARRIFPALIVVLVGVSAIGSAVLLLHEFESLMRHTVASAIFVQNFNLLGEVGYFDIDAKLKPLLHLWSLSIEEQFYLLWPLTVMACPRRWLLRVTVILALASFAAMVLSPSASAAYYLPFTRFWQILVGAALALSAISRPSLALPGMLLCALGLYGVDRDVPALSLIPTLGAAMVIAGRGRLLEARWLVSVGLVSYPLYLWHWPLLAFVHIVVGDIGPLEPLAAVLLAYLFASLTFRLVESPIRSSKRYVPQLVASMAGLAVVSAVVASEPTLRPSPPSEMAKMSDTRGDPPTGADCGLSRPMQECVGDGGRFLLLGDSHAQALFHGMRAEQSGQWAVLVRHGCAPADVPSIRNRPCSPIADALAAVAASDFETVVLVFRDAYPELPGAIAKTVQALKGKRVVVLTSVPDLAFRPRDCIDRPFSPKVDCTFKRAEVEAGQAAMRAAVKASGAEMIDVLDALCDGPRCAVDRGDMLMYRDGDHLSVRGSAVVARHVIRAMAGL